MVGKLVSCHAESPESRRKVARESRSAAGRVVGNLVRYKANPEIFLNHKALRHMFIRREMFSCYEPGIAFVSATVLV